MSSLRAHPLLIRRKEIEATRDAATILQNARQQAATIREQEAKRGYDAGLDDGVQAASRLLEDLTKAIDRYWHEREDELVTAALWLSHRIISDLEPDDRLRGIVRTALAAYRQDTALVLRAHPATAERLMTALASREEPRNVEIRSDASLSEDSIGLAHSRGHTDIGLLDQFRAMLSGQDSP
jgi:flagellar biosynthesis/type III secretory pathway protein FliH